MNGESLERIAGQVAESVLKHIPAIVAEQIKLAAVDETRRLSIGVLNDIDRQEVERWKNILIDWREYRAWLKNKAEADEAFVSQFNDSGVGRKISRWSLYRKWKAYKERGDAGLVDTRGRHRKHVRPAEIRVIPGRQGFATTAEYKEYRAGSGAGKQAAISISKR
jgi:hypothetical protein